MSWSEILPLLSPSTFEFFRWLSFAVNLRCVPSPLVIMVFSSPLSIWCPVLCFLFLRFSSIPYLGLSLSSRLFRTHSWFWTSPCIIPRSVIIVLSLFPSAPLFFGSLFYPIIVSIPHVAASRANKQTNGKAPQKAQVGDAVSFRSHLFGWNAALRMSADSGLGRRSSPCATCVAFPNWARGRKFREETAEDSWRGHLSVVSLSLIIY